MIREFKDADIEDEIREAFRVFDKEGNGFITTPDLMEVAKNKCDKHPLNWVWLILKVNSEH